MIYLRRREWWVRGSTNKILPHPNRTHYVWPDQTRARRRAAALELWASAGILEKPYFFVMAADV